MRSTTIIFFCLFFFLNASAQQIIKGKVNDGRLGIPGVTISVEALRLGTVSDSTGNFRLMIPKGRHSITFSSLGFLQKSVSIEVPMISELTVSLEAKANELQQVEIASTGFQRISRERASGSFATLNESQLNRRVTVDLVSRLEDAIPGLVINRSGTRSQNQTQISIRGQSTLFARTEPLIIIDNFQYEGEVSTINPNDIESVTILKDAAAASIWGARSGNGVIVITTKSGKRNSPLSINFNSNLTIGERPDLFYQQRMGSADYVEIEKALFAKGFYNNTENSTVRAPLTPVIELLIAKRNGTISASSADAQIEALKIIDYRNEVSRIFYQRPINQQYSLSFNGGTQSHQYYISAGLDNNRDILTNNGVTRRSLQAKSSLNFLKDRLTLNSGFSFVNQSTQASNLGQTMADGVNAYPYASLIGQNGEALPITIGYRNNFKSTAMAAGLLDWNYRPVDELSSTNNKQIIRDLRLNFGLTAKIIPGMNANILYQYNLTENSNIKNQGLGSYFTRNAINNLTQVGLNGSITRPIPLGSIVDRTTREIQVYNLRGQVDFNKTFGIHSINALAGAEIRQQDDLNGTRRAYGYDDLHANFQPVDYLRVFPRYVNPGSTAIIENLDGEQQLADRSRSFFTNVSYSVLDKYTITGSVRLDQSNIFGVSTNQKGIPLWSTGGVWEMSKENFYKKSFGGFLGDYLPIFRVRASFGYTGNVDKTLSAYTTASYNLGTGNINNSNTQLPYATIVNPPNDLLRWEKSRVINVGIDFSSRGNRISGSLDIYTKKGTDLIGSIPYAPSSGVSIFNGNTSGSKGHGLDLNIQSRNLTGKLKWDSQLIFSFSKDIVTLYKVNGTNLNYVQSPRTYPQEGNLIYAIYAYPWAGLDPQNGNPRGYLNGEVSTDYNRIINSTDLNNLNYLGSSKPLISGALRNTLNFGGLSLSANISYRLKYFFKKNTITYGNNNGLGGHSDYVLRWQKPGDEFTTNVPSLSTVNNSSRDIFYSYSEALYAKGDHIRLQDIMLTYSFKEQDLLGSKLNGLQVYFYANNLGLLWKAAKGSRDPDYYNAQFNPIRTYSIGIKFNIR